MKESRMGTIRNIRPLAILILAFGLTSLACNMPYLAGQGEQLEAELAAELAQNFDQPVRAVQLAGDTLVLTYEVPLLQAEETTLVYVVRLMEAGAQKASRADWVRVELEQGLAPGQVNPVLAVTASAKNTRLLADGRLTVEAFVNGLAYEDRRSVEQAVRQDLESLGYTVRSLSYQDGVLEVAFWQPEIDTTQALVQSWLPVWALALQRAPNASQVVLHAGLLNQPDLRVAAPATLLQEFQSGSMSPAEFLLGLDIQDE